MKFDISNLLYTNARMLSGGKREVSGRAIVPISSGFEIDKVTIYLLWRWCPVAVLSI